jgi:hypothetical protein
VSATAALKPDTCSPTLNFELGTDQFRLNEKYKISLVQKRFHLGAAEFAE